MLQAGCRIRSSLMSDNLPDSMVFEEPRIAMGPVPSSVGKSRGSNRDVPDDAIYRQASSISPADIIGQALPETSALLH